MIFCGEEDIYKYDYSHAWTNCEDDYCKDCNYYQNRTHTYGSYSWVDARSASTCEKYAKYCSACGNEVVGSYNYAHYYPTSTSRYCSDCNYARW